MTTRDERNSFSIMITENASKNQSGYLETIASYCEKNNIEVEAVVPLLNDTLKAFITEEAMRLRVIPRESQLPL